MSKHVQGWEFLQAMLQSAATDGHVPIQVQTLVDFRDAKLITNVINMDVGRAVEWGSQWW